MRAHSVCGTSTQKEKADKQVLSSGGNISPQSFKDQTVTQLRPTEQESKDGSEEPQ